MPFGLWTTFTTSPGWLLSHVTERSRYENIFLSSRLMLRAASPARSVLETAAMRTSPGMTFCPTWITPLSPSLDACSDVSRLAVVEAKAMNFFLSRKSRSGSTSIECRCMCSEVSFLAADSEMTMPSSKL